MLLFYLIGIILNRICYSDLRYCVAKADFTFTDFVKKYHTLCVVQKFFDTFSRRTQSDYIHECNAELDKKQKCIDSFPCINYHPIVCALDYGIQIIKVTP